MLYYTRIFEAVRNCFSFFAVEKRNLNSENAVLDKYIYTSYLLTSLRRTNSKLVSWFLWPMSKAVVIPRTQSCCGYSLVSPIGKSFPIGVIENQSLSTNS